MTESVSSSSESRGSSGGSEASRASSASESKDFSKAGETAERSMRGEAARSALDSPEGRSALSDSAKSVGATPQKDVSSEIAVDTAQTTAKAVTGYRADMYGEIGVGNKTVNITGQRQFGGAVKGTSLADAQYTARQGTPGAPSYGIDDFARTDARGSFAQNSAISAQATHNDMVARTRASGGPAASEVRMEVSRAQSSGTRFDDAVIGPETQQSSPKVEMKAARDIKPNQLRVDLADAKAGHTVEYVVTDNPRTGSTGLTQSSQAKLNSAVAQSNGNMSVNYKPDIAPSRASVEALETAARVSRVGRALGKVAVPVGIAADTYAISSAYVADGNRIGTETKVAVAESVGGWAGAGAGALGGAKTGAAIGTVIGGPIGTAVGAVAGGVVGAIGGALVGSGVLGGFARSLFG